MSSMLDKLMGLKKTKRALPEAEVKGKMSAITKLSDLANDSMGKKLGGIKKVTVASDSEEGLKAGLEKAEEITEEVPELEEEQEIVPCDETSSLEELDAEIQRLMALKAEKETSEEV